LNYLFFLFLLISQTKSLQCSKCDERSHFKPDFSITDASGNALGCKCLSSYLSESVDCSIDELRQAKCDDRHCSQSCQTLEEAVSIDGTQCVSCGVGSIYDSMSGDCVCSNPRKSTATNTPISTSRLIEIYANDILSIGSISKSCAPCSRGTAVISAFLYEGEEGNRYQTAGMTYIADPNTCASCPDPNMFFDTDYNCVCESGYISVGESSIGPLGCIKYMPSINSDYKSVSFYDVQDPKDFNNAVTVTVDSIVLSHYYLRAASECEYFGRVGALSFASCQTLANLCVMQLYDRRTTACRELFNIIMPQDRNPDYIKKANWKYTIPWIVYGFEENPNEILSDRGIQMKMSFVEREGYSQKLKFKLAKYAINGTFMGIENLTTQFFYCAAPSSMSPIVTDEQEMQNLYSFGKNRHFEVNCQLENVASTDMYFYEMYVVDEGSASCATQQSTTVEECLYPVPVLFSNKAAASNTPVSRRFFLFDNQVSKVKWP